MTDTTRVAEGEQNAEYPTCTIEGCSNPVKTAYRRKWCRTHYARWRRHGDPNITRVKVRESGVPTYRAMHKRVAKDKGLARNYKCSECPERAAHWAYDHKDPDEVVGPYAGNKGSCAYSLKVGHYQPMCHSCHKALDSGANVATRTHCPHGHELTPENTYTSPQGYRRCRTCQRRDGANLRARRRASK